MIGGVSLQIIFHFADVDAANGAQHKIFLGNVADFHLTVAFALVIFKGYCNVIGTVDFLAVDAGTKRITIEIYHKIQHGRTVICFDSPVVLICA